MTRFNKAQVTFTLTGIVLLPIFYNMPGFSGLSLLPSSFPVLISVIGLLAVKLALLLVPGPGRPVLFYLLFDLPFLAYLILAHSRFDLYFACLFIFLSALTLEAARSDYARELEELRKANALLDSEKEELDLKLEEFRESKEKMTKHVAELYTLQMVSDTINSTLALDRLLNTINDIIIGIMGVNTCSICIFGKDSKEIRHFVTNERQPELVEDIRNSALEYLAREQPQEGTIVQQACAGGPVTRISLTPVTKNNKTTGVIVTGHTENNLFKSEDIQFLKSICNQVSVAIENAMLYEKLNLMASTDCLTGLYNRTYFQKNLESIMSEVSDKNIVAVAMLDIDNFKAINDRYGHDAGDVVLVGLSGLVKKMIRRNDTFVRYGGEEFILIMQSITRQKGIERLEQIRRAIKNASFDYNKIKLSVTVSIGISFLEKTGETHNSVIKQADLALYIAKKNGKDRIEVYN